MNVVKRSNRDIAAFRATADEYLRKTPAAETKFHYWLGRVIKSTAKAQSDYQDKVTEINIACASVDKDKNLASDEQGHTLYTKEKSVERMKRIRQLNDEEVEINVGFTQEWPPTLTLAQRHAFEGFCIPEPEEPVDPPNGG